LSDITSEQPSRSWKLFTVSGCIGHWSM